MWTLGREFGDMGIIISVGGLLYMNVLVFVAFVHRYSFDIANYIIRIVSCGFRWFGCPQTLIKYRG